MKLSSPNQKFQVSSLCLGSGESLFTKSFYTIAFITSTLLTGFSAMAAHAEVAYKLKGSAWADAGRIMSASDTIIGPDEFLNLNGNGLQSMGAQITLLADLTPHFEAAIGFGAHKVNHSLGRGQSSFLSISMYQSFLTQSRLTWHTKERDETGRGEPGLKVTVGSYPFQYNPHVQNLGLYLLRGPVYPGILLGGYGDFHTDPTKSTMLGAHVSYERESYRLDFILNNEREIPPTLDWSLAALGSYKVLNSITLGAGINWYRAIAYNSDLTEPGSLSAVQNMNAEDRIRYIEVDTKTDSLGNVISSDTIHFTHRGIKTMAYFSIDLKPFTGLGKPQSKDWILYGETAIIGVKNYGKAYGKMSERIPVMLGFNIPTYGLLDLFSIELEWYGAKYRDDLIMVGNNNIVADWTTQGHPIPSPKPPGYSDYGIKKDSLWYFRVSDFEKKDTLNLTGPMARENVSSDNIKWSINLEKFVHKRVKFSGLIASDHYRPRPKAWTVIESAGGTAAALSDISDWYFVLRSSFYF